eukprot:6214458-Pleurochrysis_carterae.AAC.12
MWRARPRPPALAFPCQRSPPNPSRCAQGELAMAIETSIEIMSQQLFAASPPAAAPAASPTPDQGSDSECDEVSRVAHNCGSSVCAGLCVRECGRVDGRGRGKIDDERVAPTTS